MAIQNTRQMEASEQENEEHLEEQQIVEQGLEPVQQSGFVKILTSPYVLLLVPLLVGGFYLVENPQYVAMAVNYPWAWACVGSIAVVYFLIRVIITFFTVITTWIQLQFERARKAKRNPFLEFVICVFMFVSVCESGPFFNEVQGNILGGALGYVTILAFDLVAVVCMKMRAKMLRRGHDRQARIYQLGVWICAIVSAYANFYSAIRNLHGILQHPDILALLAPLAGVTFSVMIVFLSHATDSDEDEVDDPEIFRAEQEKLVSFIRIKREKTAAILEERTQLALLAEREFLVKSWFFTKAKIALVIDAVTIRVVELVYKEIKKLREEIATREKTIKEQAGIIENQVLVCGNMVQKMERLRSEYEELYGKLQDQNRDNFGTFITQFRDDYQAFTNGINQRYQGLSQIVNQQISVQHEPDYQGIVAHILPLLPGPEKVDYRKITDPIEARITLRYESVLKTLRKEISELRHAQEMNIPVEVSGNLSGKFLGNPGGTSPEVSGKSDGSSLGNLVTVFEEISEEEYGEISGTTEERTTDPEMETFGKSSGSGMETQVPPIDIVNRKKPLTIEETARVIQRSQKTVRDLREGGKLKVSGGNKNLITVASVRALLASREKNKVS